MDRLNAMQAFVAAVETGSFAAAARRAKLGASAVSHAIAGLERHVGVALLARTSRGLAPTEAGQQYYERACRVLDEADEAEQAARGVGGGLTGTLRVSASPAVASLHVVPVLEAFLDEHPDLGVELRLDDRHAEPSGAHVDVALRIGHGAADGAAAARKIGERARRVIGSNAYFRRAGMPATPEELAHHQVVVGDGRAGGAVWRFRRHGTEVSVETSGRLRVCEAEGVRAATLAGLGLAIASEWLFDDALRDGRVCTVLEQWTLPPVELWAVFPAGPLAPARARAFVAFVEATLGVAAAQRDPA